MGTGENRMLNSLDEDRLSRAIEAEDKVSGGIMAMKPESISEIPEDERWVHENPEIKKSMERGLEQAAKGQFVEMKFPAEHI